MSRHDADSASINSLSSLLRTDDESATTTSTESESFESWTLITDKQKAKAAALQTKTNNNNKNNPATTVENNRDPETAMYSGVQLVHDYAKTTDHLDATEENNSSNKNLTDNEKDADELSDGISIISESSESIGRLSPHPLLRAHLHNIINDDTMPSLLNKTQDDAAHIELLETDDEQKTANTQTRRRKRSNENTTEQALQPAAEERTEQKPLDLVERISSHPLVKRGANCLFYAGVTLALLAFIGRLRHPEWNVDNGQTFSELEQKINDLALQHNLMSAEIDLLNKQVNYLSGLDDKSQSASGGGAKYKEEYPKPSKTFKAWSGNGKNMNPVHINKENLKRPYKCGENDNFVEVGGICVEKTAEFEEPLVDQVGNAVNDILQESETFKSFEKVAEAFLNKGNVPTNDDNVNNEEESNNQWRKEDQQYNSDNRPPTTMPFTPNSKEFKSKKNYHYKQQSRERNDNSDEDDDDGEHNSQQRMYAKRKYNSKERNYKNKRSSEERNSKERYDNYNKKQFKQHSSEERGNKFKDPNWHNNLMQQREELRRQRHNHDKSNWFIERGDSREQARST